MSAKRRRGGGELDGVGAGGVAAGAQLLPSLPTMLAHGSAQAAAAAGVLDHDGLEALGLAQEQARRREVGTTEARRRDARGERRANGGLERNTSSHALSASLSVRWISIV